MSSNYVNTIYDPKEKPVTAYPDQLIQYLINRYHITKKAKILDSGSGRGDFARAFARRGRKTWAIDGFDYKKSLEDKVKFVGSFDLETGILPFEDNFFDVVFSKSVLEHIHKPERYLMEIKRVLKQGGVFIVMVPDWYTQMYVFYDDYSHVQPYTQKGLEDTLKVFGFSDVHAEVFYQLPIIWRYPCVKIVSKVLQIVGGPVKKISRNKFYRFSRELMILASAYKK